MNTTVVSPIEYVVAMVVIVTTGFLAYEGSVDAGVFSSLVTLCLGYVFGRQVATTANGTNGNDAK